MAYSLSTLLGTLQVCDARIKNCIDSINLEQSHKIITENNIFNYFVNFAEIHVRLGNLLQFMRGDIDRLIPAKKEDVKKKLYFYLPHSHEGNKILRSMAERLSPLLNK